MKNIVSIEPDIIPQKRKFEYGPVVDFVSSKTFLLIVSCDVTISFPTSTTNFLPVENVGFDIVSVSYTHLTLPTKA